MPALDPHQLKILKGMGIDVWCLRERATLINEAPVISEAPAITEVQAESSEDVFPDRILTLESIAGEIRNCKNCDLHLQRNNTVPGEGSIRADWMFVGEAPGNNEDKEGLPFVGRAGQLLNAMIQALSMDRSDVFIANVIKCRPPNNRDPLESEVTQCAHFLHKQLSLVRPRVIIALGRVSAQLLLKTSDSMAAMRRKKHFYGENQIPLVATYHPAYLLRRPEEKYKAWEDLLMARSIVAQLIE